MTISSSTSKSGPYSGNGVTTVFARTFYIRDADHLKVYETTAGVTTEVTTGITKDGIDADSGNVTFVTAPSTGTEITLLLEVPLTQETDYSAQGKVSPEQAEDDFDLGVQQVQQVSEKQGRSLQIPVTEVSIGNLPALAVRAGKFSAYDASGDPIAASGIPSVPVSTYMAAFLDDTSALAARATLHIFDDYSALAADTALTTANMIIGNIVRYGSFSCEYVGTSGGDIQNSATTPLHFNVLPDSTGVYAVDAFGVDGTELGDSAAIRAAFVAAGGSPVVFQEKRYYYDGAVIATDPIVLRGAGAPRPNAGKTTMVGGTIFEGTLSFTGKDLDLRDFGVDLGSATSAPVGDGLKCTATLNAGGHLHLENVSALLKNKTDAYHAIVLESYQEVTGGGIYGAHGYFGCVLKCQNVSLTRIKTSSNNTDGLYIKSDTTFGRSKNVNIGQVIVEGDGSQTNGVRVQATDDLIENVNIDQVLVSGCATSIFVQCTSASPITDVNIRQCVLTAPSSHGVNSSAGSATINGLALGDVSIVNAADTGIEFSGVHKAPSISHANIVFASGTTQTEWDKGVVVGASIVGTLFGSIAINEIYNIANLGGIKYNNTNWAYHNEIGMHLCILKGAGKPFLGFTAPTDTGATVKVTPSFNRREKSSLVKAKPTGNTIVTSFEHIIQSGGLTELYATGHVLTIINDSAFTYTVNHTVGGKIINTGGANVVIAQNETASWVFGGAVWHQK